MRLTYIVNSWGGSETKKRVALDRLNEYIRGARAAEAKLAEENKALKRAEDLLELSVYTAKRLEAELLRANERLKDAEALELRTVGDAAKLAELKRLAQYELEILKRL